MDEIDKKILEQRKDLRISGSVIEYSYVQAASVKLTAFMKDLSVGGVCIYIHDQIDLNTHLNLLIHHFGNQPPIETVGEVVWQRPSNYLNCYDTGIKFVELEQTEREKLETFIHSFVKKNTPTQENDSATEQQQEVVEPQIEISSSDGVYKQFYSSGELLSEVNIADGKMEGAKKYYYRSGELLEELNWKNGKRHGPRKCYYSNGRVYLEQTFENDTCVDIKKYDNQGNIIDSSE